MPPPIVAVTLLALAATPGLAADLQGFSFDYQISGDRSITPYQVFDDGAATFLQFRDPERIPSIFVRDRQGARLVSPQVQGNYQRIAEVAERLELVSDRKTAAVISMHRRSPLPLPLQQAASGSNAENSEAATRATALARPAAPEPRAEALTRTALVAPLDSQGPPATLIDSAPIARWATRAPGDSIAELQKQIELLRHFVEALSERSARPAVNSKDPEPILAANDAETRQALTHRATALAAECGAGSSKAPAQSSDAPARGTLSAATASAAPSALAFDKDAPQVFVFEVQGGQRLSEAVRRFVAVHRLDLDWDTGGADFEIRYGFRVTGGTLDEVLFGVLSPFKLNAVTRRGNSIVAVFRAA
ncbi:MAG TPA: TrbG/VirB9 family P-type conjugative transfer protein [Usitatibacter sp.]|nr:TrbG/VirB9 family P-type conjugative transfer protein [Usitatibacter sp.]